MKVKELLEVINMNSRVVLIDYQSLDELEETTASDEITLEKYEECEVTYVDVYALDYEGYATYHIEISPQDIKKPVEMFTVNELKSDELNELKQRYYAIKIDEEENRDVSMGELAMIDELVSDEEVKEFYSDAWFTSNDFFCNC